MESDSRFLEVGRGAEDVVLVIDGHSAVPRDNKLKRIVAQSVRLLGVIPFLFLPCGPAGQSTLYPVYPLWIL